MIIIEDIYNSFFTLYEIVLLPFEREIILVFGFLSFFNSVWNVWNNDTFYILFIWLDVGCGGGWPSFDYDYMDHWPGRYVWARHDDHDNNILFSEDHECRAMFTGISWSLTRDNFSIYVGGEDVQQTGRQLHHPGDLSLSQPGHTATTGTTRVRSMSKSQAHTKYQ